MPAKKYHIGKSELFIRYGDNEAIVVKSRGFILAVTKDTVVFKLVEKSEVEKVLINAIIRAVRYLSAGKVGRDIREFTIELIRLVPKVYRGVPTGGVVVLSRERGVFKNFHAKNEEYYVLPGYVVLHPSGAVEHSSVLHIFRGVLKVRGEWFYTMPLGDATVFYSFALQKGEAVREAVRLYAFQQTDILIKTEGKLFVGNGKVFVRFSPIEGVEFIV